MRDSADENEMGDRIGEAQEGGLRFFLQRLQMYPMSTLWPDCAGQRAEFFDSVKCDNFKIYVREERGWTRKGILSRRLVREYTGGEQHDTVLLFMKVEGEKVIRKDAWPGVQLDLAVADALITLKEGNVVAIGGDQYFELGRIPNYG